MSARAWSCLLLVSCAVARPALADPPQADVAALSETLFHEGKRLMSEGRLDEACPKLAESHRLDPGGGTLLTVALCHEAQGKTATAWAEFDEALTLALRDGNAQREAVAREHKDALTPKLSRLVVRVAPAVAALPSLEVRRDDVVLPRAAWGVAVPVDPGLHVVVASAPGHQPSTVSHPVASGGDNQVVEIAALAPLAPPPIQPDRRTAERADGDAGQPQSLRLIGWVAGGVGLAAIGAGIAFGVRAASLDADADARCPEGRPCSDREAVSLSASAGTSADVATVLVSSGSVALAAGVVIFVATRRSRAPRAAVLSW